jgi:hypothetical protein
MNIESQIEERSRPVTNWAPIVGLWDFDDGRATYKALQEGQQPPLFGLCVSDARFAEGEAGATLRRVSGTVMGSLLVGYQSLTNDYYLVGLGGFHNAYNVVHFDPSIGKWRVVAKAGAQQNLRPGRSYKIVVRIRGQRITLEIDGVRVLEHVLDVPLPTGQLGLFGWWGEGEQGDAEFSDVSVREEPGTAFVVMQLSDGRFQELYEQVIREVAKDFGLIAVHAGDLPGPGLIIQDIASSIEQAKIVVAEITVPNQNVFYELGYAHAKNKPTVLLAEKGRELPFDVHGYR